MLMMRMTLKIMLMVMLLLMMIMLMLLLMMILLILLMLMILLMMKMQLLLMTTVSQIDMIISLPLNLLGILLLRSWSSRSRWLMFARPRTMQFIYVIEVGKIITKLLGLLLLMRRGQLMRTFARS